MNGAAVQAFPEGDGPDRLELNSGVGDVSLYFGGMAPPPPHRNGRSHRRRRSDLSLSS